MTQPAPMLTVVEPADAPPVGRHVSPADDRAPAPGRPPDRPPPSIDWRFPVAGVILAIIVHVGILYTLAREADNISINLDAPPPTVGLCDGHRCMFGETSRLRRGLDDAPTAAMDLIDVAIIPQLGLKEPEPQQLPELVKYEQPETVQDGINIENDNVVPQPIPEKENLPKPAELDKRRKSKSLDDILGAPRDDDPRKRASALDKIIGSPRGSVYGGDPTGKEGDLILGQVQTELRKQFTVPTSLTDQQIRSMSADVTLKVNAKGEIESYAFVRRSGNGQFDSAVTAAIKRFIPAEGGSRRLPELPPEVISNINARRFFFTFDGKKLVR